MFGYTVTINGSSLSKKGDICYKNILCSNYMINKFEQDKVFTETEDYILLLDGVILNRKSLMDESKEDCIKTGWSDTLLNLYNRNGEQFFKVLRGSFSGALYDKKKDKFIFFVDQLGSKFTYYAKVGDFFCCSEVMGYMYELLRDNGVQYHLSKENAFLLLTYGYMLDDRTLCEEIHKINPGCYIIYENGLITEKQYYLLDNTTDTSIDEKQAIEIVDKYFRQAIVREFEKDKEYDYKHLVALSGGLDCRMTSFVAHDCGYERQLNMTFSQTDYWDQTIPMRMARDMCHEWIFKALDNGMWLYDVDDVTKTTGGNVLYYGTAHGNSLLKYLNFETLGLSHSGQIGDVVIGSFISASEKNKPYKLGEKAYSTKYLKYLGNLQLKLDVNAEIGKFYYRAFHGTNNGLQNVYNYTETLSPFLDLDLLEKALSIPVELRQNHRIYKKWILEKYPQAAKYEWETTGRKINSPVLRIGDREIPVANIPKSINEHIRLFLGKKERKNNSSSMNPIAYYIEHNMKLRTFLNNYFRYADCIEDTGLHQVIIDIKDSGTAMEKIQAVSLLAAIKMYYSL